MGSFTEKPVTLPGTRLGQGDISDFAGLELLVENWVGEVCSGEDVEVLSMLLEPSHRIDRPNPGIRDGNVMTIHRLP